MRLCRSPKCCGASSGPLPAASASAALAAREAAAMASLVCGRCGPRVRHEDECWGASGGGKSAETR